MTTYLPSALLDASNARKLRRDTVPTLAELLGKATSGAATVDEAPPEPVKAPAPVPVTEPAPAQTPSLSGPAPALSGPAPAPPEAMNPFVLPKLADLVKAWGTAPLSQGASRPGGTTPPDAQPSQRQGPFILPDLADLVKAWGPSAGSPPNAADTGASSSALPRSAASPAGAGGAAPAPASGQRLPPDQAVNQISALVPKDLPLGNPTEMAKALAPALRFAEQQLGISAASAFSIIMAENGAGNSPLSAQHNNFFSLSSTKDDPFQSDRSARFGGYATPGDGVAAFYHWMTDFPRYKEALANGQDHAGFINGLVKAGYIVPEPGFPVEDWVKNTAASAGLFTQAAGAGTVAPTPANPSDVQGTPGAGGAARPVAANGYTADTLVPDQFKEGLNAGLSWNDAASICGIASAVAFARAANRTPTLGEALQLAKSSGLWNADVGMTTGSRGEVDLLKKLGVAARVVEGVDPNIIASEVKAGRPVQINAQGNGGHFYVASDYRPDTGEFLFGASLSVLRKSGGATWARIDQLPSYGVGTPANMVLMHPDQQIHQVMTTPQPAAPDWAKPAAVSPPPAAVPLPPAPPLVPRNAPVQAAPAVEDVAPAPFAPDVQATPSSYDVPSYAPEMAGVGAV